ncbi:MAG TPA: beta-L-arabinofuranosidase domain-containing protein [Chthonomonadales bacterium]|nr:beta-L-arabinofuranosidase domain-containing protein [Chthonomonadales bacterium]
MAPFLVDTALVATVCALPGAPAPMLALDTPAPCAIRLGGELGRRLEANVVSWLLPAPDANPGLLAMMRVRDREPAPQIMPWAGEFVGKYLLAAIGALRTTDDPRLRATVRRVVHDLLATQAEDGYLGPFPRAQRLRGNWDLWGHYHCMLALMDWYEATGDRGALRACRRAAALMRRTFDGKPLRVYDAGSHEMNMAVHHALARLHRLTGDRDALALARDVEADWERAGDYLRTGIAAMPFYRTPRPRWESLPNLQGLLEMHRITGGPAYRTALLNHWRSILRYDVHNTGGFSTNEQASGNPYAQGAIETCCVIAWMALSVDALRLTGDPLVADELERTTLNAALGAQHPSGRWWTYNTPMDGVREASAHSIVFQARPGTPELNCCSVNAPRALGMLADWAVMSSRRGLAVMWLGPGRWRGRAPDGTPVELVWRTSYPLRGDVRIEVRPRRPVSFELAVRVPAWAAGATGAGVGGQARPLVAGSMWTTRRIWRSGDALTLRLPMRVRAVAGDREAAGRVSLFRGPLLLAWDQAHSSVDEERLPAIDVAKLSRARVVPSAPALGLRATGPRPWLLVELATVEGGVLRLCDFASAGAAGTRYRSWLPAASAPPPPPMPLRPWDGAKAPPGPAVLQWRSGSASAEPEARFVVEVAATPRFASPIYRAEAIAERRHVLAGAWLAAQRPGRTYWWRVGAMAPSGRVVWNEGPPMRFTVDASLPPLTAEELAPRARPDAALVTDALRGRPAPERGRLQSAAGWAPDGPDAVRTNGTDGLLVYEVPGDFPDEEHTVRIRVRVESMPGARTAQIVSAWCAPMDDPVRVCIDNGRLYARIEAGAGYSTPGVDIEAGRWYALALVKSGAEMTLYVDGRAASRSPAPTSLFSSSRAIAVGGNPLYRGTTEFLHASFADFALLGRAMSAEEVAAWAGAR